MPANTGIGGIGWRKKLWSLTDLDTGDVFYGQYVAQSLVKNVSANVVSSPVPNRENPIVQWIGGTLETITFTARLWALHSQDTTPEDRVAKLETLVTRQDDLNRIPICTFAIGNISSLTLDCLVTSLGGISYDEPKDDGTLRGATLQITLTKFEEVNFVETNPSIPETFTRIRRAKFGDTYESIAADEYDDAELGILLRQLNPREPGMLLSDLNPKDPVHIFPDSHLLTLEIQPEFPAFREGSEDDLAKAVRREMFELRSDDSFTTHFSDTGTGEF